MHNPQTGLLTRNEFIHQAGALSSAGAGVLLLLDVDRLANLNFTSGFEVGDAYLQAAGRIVREEAGGLVGRWAGDEFIAFVEDASQADAIVERIHARMRAGFFEQRARVVAEFPDLAGKPVLTFSIGASRARPGSTVEQLAQESDQALTAAKKAGRRCLVWA